MIRKKNWGEWWRGWNRKWDSILDDNNTNQMKQLIFSREKEEENKKRRFSPSVFPGNLRLRDDGLSLLLIYNTFPIINFLIPFCSSSFPPLETTKKINKCWVPVSACRERREWCGGLWAGYPLPRRPCQLSFCRQVFFFFLFFPFF